MLKLKIAKIKEHIIDSIPLVFFPGKCSGMVGKTKTTCFYLGISTFPGNEFA
jgi:hypothetical protein